jgi:hypothetical protein
MAELRYSGTPTQVAYTYTLTLLQQTTANQFSVTNNTDLNLPAGHYYAAAHPDFTRTSTSRTNQIHWFIDGVQIGKVGGSDYHGGESCDLAEATFTLHQSGVLTLRQTAQANGTISLTNDALAYIWRVER